MKTITLVVDEEMQGYLAKQAERYGLSVEEYVLHILRQTLHKDWQRIVKRLAGAWQDFPEPEEVMLRTGDTRNIETL